MLAADGRHGRDDHLVTAATRAEQRFGDGPPGTAAHC